MSLNKEKNNPKTENILKNQDMDLFNNKQDADLFGYILILLQNHQS